MNITEQYKDKLDNIYNQLSELEKKQIFELTKNSEDSSCAILAQNLKNDITNLINDINYENHILSVDDLLNSLNIIFKNYWIDYKKHNKPYAELIDNLKFLKNSSKKQELLLILQNNIDSKESFLSFETTIWGSILTIIGIFFNMVVDLIVSNYEKLTGFQFIHPNYYAIGISIFSCFIIMLYCFSIFTNNKKEKKKCFYKFIYNYLTQEEIK